MESVTLKVALVFVLHTIVTMAASVKKSSDSSSELGRGMSRPYFIAYACERTVLSLQCGPKEKIHLAHATYGRQNMNHCNNGRHADVSFWSRHCTAPVRRTTRVVAQMCNGRQSCLIPVVNMLFSDPCPTTYKYLEIYYTCAL